MKIAIGGISHETNTYCQGLTVTADFYQLRANKLLGTGGRQTDVGGAVDACAQLGIEVVPLLHAWAQPSGTIERATYETFRQEIVDQLSAEAVDGVYLALHGAGVVDSIAGRRGSLDARVGGHHRIPAADVRGTAGRLGVLTLAFFSGQDFFHPVAELLSQFYDLGNRNIDIGDLIGRQNLGDSRPGAGVAGDIHHGTAIFELLHFKANSFRRTQL